MPTGPGEGRVPPTIRPSREDDVAAIAAIYGHAVATDTASFELEPPTVAAMGERRAALVDAGFPYLVAEEAGRVLGYAYAGPYRLRPAYRWTVEDSIYVAPDAKGRGVGRVLLGALIARSEALGFRLMVAVMGDAATGASVALHRALGFRDAGVFEGIGWKHGRWLATVQMQRPLGEGASTPPPDR